jgi:hypothetical protein
MGNLFPAKLSSVENVEQAINGFFDNGKANKPGKKVIPSLKSIAVYFG